MENNTTDLDTSDQPAPDPIRPELKFTSITFSGGQKISVDSDDIIVFVGPNNAGKSAALRELNSWLARSKSGVVITNAEIHSRGNASDLQLYLDTYAQKTGETHSVSYGGIGYNINQSHISYFDGRSDRHPVAPFFCAHLQTEQRINGADPAGSIALYNAPPSHPIHLLLMDDKLEERISGYFKRAFGTDIFVFRAGGSSFPLRVGDKPQKAANEDGLSKSFVEKVLSSTVELREQGDGMRSFATVLLNVLVSDTHSVQLLDEPEAFLHPPQARLLGEYIAKERRANSQLFIATHSADLLQGLMSSSNPNIRIIRIERTADLNKIKELDKNMVASLVGDSLSRYSSVINGVFFKHVVIAESDSDCLFYSALLDLPIINNEITPDVHFIHASGKHRIAKLVRTLNALGVPNSSIVDIDVLREENDFKAVFEAAGGEWKNIQNKYRALKKAIEEKNPPASAEQIIKRISAELDKVGTCLQFPPGVETQVKAIMRERSPWHVIKKAGKSAIPSGQATINYNEITKECEKHGIWIVPVGELEGFCKSIGAAHGPTFVAKVLDEKNLSDDPELEEARKFVQRIWNSMEKRRIQKT